MVHFMSNIRKLYTITATLFCLLMIIHIRSAEPRTVKFNLQNVRSRETHIIEVPYDDAQLVQINDIVIKAQQCVGSGKILFCGKELFGTTISMSDLRDATTLMYLPHRSSDNQG